MASLRGRRPAAPPPTGGPRPGRWDPGSYRNLRVASLTRGVSACMPGAISSGFWGDQTGLFAQPLAKPVSNPGCFQRAQRPCCPRAERGPGPPLREQLRHLPWGLSSAGSTLKFLPRAQRGELISLPCPSHLPGKLRPGGPDSSRTRLHPPSLAGPRTRDEGCPRAAARPCRLTFSGGLGDSVSVNMRSVRSRIECFSLWNAELPPNPIRWAGLASNEPPAVGYGQAAGGDRGGRGGAGEALHSPLLPPGCLLLWESRVASLPSTQHVSQRRPDRRGSRQPSSCAAVGCARQRALGRTLQFPEFSYGEFYSS